MTARIERSTDHVFACWKGGLGASREANYLEVEKEEMIPRSESLRRIWRWQSQQQSRQTPGYRWT